MMNKISADGAARADVLIEPRFDSPTGLKDYRHSDQFVAAGRLAAATAHERLKERLPWIE